MGASTAQRKIFVCCAACFYVCLPHVRSYAEVLCVLGDAIDADSDKGAMRKAYFKVRARAVCVSIFCASTHNAPSTLAHS